MGSGRPSPAHTEVHGHSGPRRRHWRPRSCRPCGLLGRAPTMVMMEPLGLMRTLSGIREGTGQ